MNGKTIKIFQSNKGAWFILSEDEEQIRSRHSTARDAACRAIYDHMDRGPLTLEIHPYSDPVSEDRAEFDSRALGGLA